MKQVAKLLIIVPRGKHLLLRRGDHPVFGNDPDLPGGTLEDGETLPEAVTREVEEEAGLDITGLPLEHLYRGTEYSKVGTEYNLFVVRINSKPDITLSWEHTSHAWVDRKDLIMQAKTAEDEYMHMVADVLTNHKLI